MNNSPTCSVYDCSRGGSVAERDTRNVEVPSSILGRGFLFFVACRKKNESEATRRVRTADLPLVRADEHTKRVLCQLSYGGVIALA